MVSSWPNFVSHCKSRLSAVARSCFLGREHWRETFRELDVLLRELREKREDVEQVYRATAKRCGLPRAVGSDGAVELRKPAESLGKQRKRPLVLRDPKHFLANKFEALRKRDPQYQAFANPLAGTRSAIQQTELAHLVPRVFKTKAKVKTQ